MKYIFKANYVSDKNKYYFVKIKNIKKKYNYVMNHIRISKISFGNGVFESGEFCKLLF